jgi:hypothetical protein
MNDLNLKINEQILKTNKTFTNILGSLYFKGLMSDDITSLENVLTKVNRNFKTFYVISIIMTLILVPISLLKYFELMDSIKMDKIGIALVSSFGIMFATYRYYKVKVNLEFKIFLLKIIQKK